MDEWDSEWQRKGATLSDKTAREKFGLTPEEIVQAIRGKHTPVPGKLDVWEPFPGRALLRERKTGA